MSLRTGSAIKWYVNDSTGQFDYPPATSGMWLITRTGSNADAVNHNNFLLDTSTNTSTALTSSSLYLVGGDDYNNGTLLDQNADQISAVVIGGGLTPTQATNLSSLINAYMTSIGSNIY